MGKVAIVFSLWGLDAFFFLAHASIPCRMSLFFLSSGILFSVAPWAEAAVQNYYYEWHLFVPGLRVLLVTVLYWFLRASWPMQR